MSMEGGASGSAAVTDSAMAEAGAVDPDLALGVFSLLMFAASTILAHTVFVAIN
jgi:26S proteasome regulatory subunit N10